MTTPTARHRRRVLRPLGLLSAGLLLTLAACGSTAASPPSNAEGAPASASAARTDSSAPLHDQLPPELAAAGVINVASSIGYPPFESFGDDGTTIEGLDFDLAQALGKQLGVELKFQNTSFDSIIPGLASKRYDMAISAMSDTPERRKQVDFVDYVRSGGGFLIPAGNPAGIKQLADLCGHKVAVNKGTTLVDDAEKQSQACKDFGKGPLDISVYPSDNQMLLALGTGRADVAMTDTVAAIEMAKNADGKFEASPPYEEGFFGLVFPKGSKQLQSAFTQALTALRDSGKYGQIFDKYGLEAAELDTFSTNAGS